jgi:molybdopterin-guanine dinucleotide biosynthesis protein A
MPDADLPFCAVVLAGGRAARLDGADKASVEIAGRTLLQWTLDAVVDAAEVVVVGDQVPTDRPVTFTRESPAYGGPVAALLTGVDALSRSTPTVAVVAVDMPRLTAYTVRRLREAAHHGSRDSAACDGAVLVDPGGRRQLAMLLEVEAIARLRPDHEGQHDLALHRFLSGFELVEVMASGTEHRDVDTWADLRDLS